MAKIIVWFINLYQKTLSPDHGPLKVLHPHGYCKYYPSCSEYTKQAVVKHGAIKGGFLGVKRILSCNPFAKGGVDLV